MTFHIITIFPQIFSSYFKESILKRAQERGLIKIKIYDLRNWADGRHRQVDDAPYGGGAGMVLKVEPLYRALREIRKKLDPAGRPAGPKKTRTILLSAKGETWQQAKAKKFLKFKDVVLICGRYEGVDERVKKFTDEEISVGDYILTGGEIPAMVIIDSLTRLLPGVLGNEESARYESHSAPNFLEHPHYTRPAVFEAGGKKYKVPKALLSGNHKEIEKWREKHSKAGTTLTPLVIRPCKPKNSRLADIKSV